MSVKLLKNKMVFLFLIPISFFCLLTNNVYAADNAPDNSVMDAVKLRALYTCISTRMKDSIDIPVGGLKNGIGDLFTTDDDDLPLPTGGYGHNIGDDTITCKDLMAGFSDTTILNRGSWNGIISGASNEAMDGETTAKVMTSLGYENNNSTNDISCRRIRYALQTDQAILNKEHEANKYTGSFCVGNVDENGTFNDNSVVVNELAEYSGASSGVKVRFSKWNQGKQLQVCKTEVNMTTTNYNDSSICRYIDVKSGDTIQNFAENVKSELTKLYPGFTEPDTNYGGGATVNAQYQIAAEEAVSSSASNAKGTWTPKGGSTINAAYVAIENLHPNWRQETNYTFKVSDGAKSHLHKWYFTKYYEASLICEGDEAFSNIPDPEVNKNYLKLERKISDKTCYVKVGAHRNDKVHGIDTSNLSWYKDYDIEGLIAVMTDDELLNAATVADPGSDASTSQDGNSDAETDPCATADLFGMGWLLCSSLKNGTQTLDPLEGMIQQMLAVNPTLYGMYYKGTKNETATYQAWKIIRGVANFLMIIIFLVVIFSQITGHGIDNYGIKKILPKLILGAILINLSFIICELIVDLSNILGQGLDSLFYSIAEGIENSSGSQYNALSMWSMTGIVDSFLAGLGIAGVGAGVGGLVLDYVGIDSGGTLVIILLLAVALILIALLIFFASLGARMIIIVICVAVSPVAFTLYILPNTQKLFQKWWKLFEAALIIYPICGALYGISQLIRVIIFSTGSEVFIWEGVIAVIAPYIPFFAIPLLLKSAISALGVAGAALTAIGSGLRNSTSKAVSGVQNSELYKDRINMAADTHNKAALAQAQARRERLLEKGRSTKGVDREIQRLARRRLQFDKEGVDRDMATNPSRLAAAQAAIRNQARENEIQGYMAQISGNQFEDSKGHIVNGSSPDAVRDALMAEMALPEEEQSYAKQAALYRTLENKGKPGLKAMREILDSPIAYSDANRQTISDMVNNNALKDQYKSAHEVAKNIQNNMQAAYTSATNENKDKKPGEPLANPADKYATTDTAGKSGMVKARLDSGEDNAQIKYDEISNLHKDQLQSYLESSYTDPALSEALDRSLSSPDSNYNADQLQTIYNGRAENIANHIDEKFNASPSTQIESTNAIDAAKLIGSSESRSYVSEATTDKVINSLQNYQNRKGGAPIDTELISGGWTKGPDPHTLTNGGSYIYHTDTGTFEKKAK